MASILGCSCILWFCFIGLSSANVLLNGEWKEDTGLQVTCAWEIYLNDSLQSVRLFRNDVQYVDYRPERSGSLFSQMIPSNDLTMTIKCQLASAQGQRGKCSTIVDIYENATEDTYRCEVSGEGPKFRLETKTYNVFVPPSNAVVTATTTNEEGQNRRILNCTSSGLPAPKLVWNVDGQVVPSDFSKTTWNSKTKLWHSWSTLNPQKDNVLVTCIPEVKSKSGLVERGLSASSFSAASWLGVPMKVIAFTLILSFLR